MDRNNLDISDVAALVAVVLSVISLIVSVFALLHQREANRISKLALESETIPQIEVETDIGTNAITLRADNILTGETSNLELFATITVKNKGKDTVTITRIGMSTPGYRFEGLLMWEMLNPPRKSVNLPQTVQPREMFDLELNTKKIEDELKRMGWPKEFTIWVTDTVDQKFHSPTIDRNEFYKWFQQFLHV